MKMGRREFLIMWVVFILQKYLRLGRRCIERELCLPNFFIALRIRKCDFYSLKGVQLFKGIFKVDEDLFKREDEMGHEETRKDFIQGTILGRREKYKVLWSIEKDLRWIRWIEN